MPFTLDLDNIQSTDYFDGPLIPINGGPATIEDLVYTRMTGSEPSAWVRGFGIDEDGDWYDGQQFRLFIGWAYPKIAEVIRSMVDDGQTWDTPAEVLEAIQSVDLVEMAREDPFAAPIAPPPHPEDATRWNLNLENLSEEDFLLDYEMQGRMSRPELDYDPVSLEQGVKNTVDKNIQMMASTWAVDLRSADRQEFIMWAAPKIEAHIRMEAANGRTWDSSEGLIATILGFDLHECARMNPDCAPVPVPGWVSLDGAPPIDPVVLADLRDRANRDRDAAVLVRYISDLHTRLQAHLDA